MRVGKRHEEGGYFSGVRGQHDNMHGREKLLKMYVNLRQKVVLMRGN